MITLTDRERELYTALMTAMGAAQDDLRTRFDALKAELETRAEQLSAQLYDDEWNGSDVEYEALEQVAKNIQNTLEENLGCLDTKITDAHREWKDKLKLAFG